MLSPYIYPGLSFIPRDLEEILSIVASTAGFNVAELRTKRRKAEVVTARHIYCYLAKENTPYSYSTIGSVLGEYDHSTVIYACNKTRERIDVKDALTMSLLNKIQKNFYNTN